MDWTDRAKRRMADLDMTQTNLAERLGVSRAAAGHYLTGLRKPNPQQLVQISEILEISLDELLIGQTTLNKDRMTAAIEALEVALAVSKKTLPPSRKAGLINYLYIQQEKGVRLEDLSITDLLEVV